MAYIDREKLLERLKFKRDTDNIDGKKYAGLECAIAQCLKAPTEDVVPREELETRLHLAEEAFKVASENAENARDKVRELEKQLEQAKQEGAIEVIEYLESNGLLNIETWAIAELKKKYIGEKQ